SWHAPPARGPALGPSRSVRPFRIDGERQADNGLDAGAGELLRELECSEQVRGIGEGNSGHGMPAAQVRQHIELDGTLKHRIGGADPQVNEVRYPVRRL